MLLFAILFSSQLTPPISLPGSPVSYAEDVSDAEAGYEFQLKVISSKVGGVPVTLVAFSIT